MRVYAYLMIPGYRVTLGHPLQPFLVLTTVQPRDAVLPPKSVYVRSCCLNTCFLCFTYSSSIL